jgi:hypothetical protein
MIEKYGFVYIWFDRKRKMYYIGCHWGNVDDGYICSSNRMRDAYRRRPYDFKRRILQRVYKRTELLDSEYKWLSLVEDKHIGIKYYNLRKHKWGHWSTDLDSNKKVADRVSEHQRKLVLDGTHFLLSEKHPCKISSKNGTHPWQSEDHKEKTRQIQYDRVAKNQHPFSNPELSKKTNKERIKNKTHNFLSNNRKSVDERRCHTWEILFPDGKTVVIKNLKSFCKEHNLNQGAMNQVGLGRKKDHKGFTCRKLKKGNIMGKPMKMEKK